MWTRDSILDLIRRFVQLIDKRFDKAKATALLRQFAGVHAHAVKIGLKRGEAAVKPRKYGETGLADPVDMEPLSKVIEALNQQFGTKFTTEDRVVIEQLEQKLAYDAQLEQQPAPPGGSYRGGS